MERAQHSSILDFGGSHKHQKQTSKCKSPLSIDDTTISSNIILGALKMGPAQF